MSSRVQTVRTLVLLASGAAISIGLITLIMDQFEAVELDAIGRPLDFFKKSRPSAFDSLRYASGNNSQFLAHAPGYSVISNAYWRDGTWLLITDQPWSMPDVSKVVSNAPDYGGSEWTTDKEIKVLSPKAAEAEGLLVAVEDVDGVSVSLLRSR